MQCSRSLVVSSSSGCDQQNIIRNDGHSMIFHKSQVFDLLDKAYHIAKISMTTHVGNVLSSDVFINYFKKNIELGKWGVKAVEMEAAALYYLAA